jgi:hypothetical protein
MEQIPSWINKDHIINKIFRAAKPPMKFDVALAIELCDQCMDEYLSTYLKSQPSPEDKPEERTIEEIIEKYRTRPHLYIHQVKLMLEEYASQEVRKALQEQTELRWPTDEQIKVGLTDLIEKWFPGYPYYMKLGHYDSMEKAINWLKQVTIK